MQKDNSQSIETMKKCGINFELISIFGKNTIINNEQIPDPDPE